jgi:hypothetical protein
MIKMFCNQRIQYGIAEELQALIRFPALVNILQKGAVKERFKEEGPIPGVIPDDALEPGEVEPFSLQTRYQGLDLQADAWMTSMWNDRTKEFSKCREHTGLRPNRHMTQLPRIFSEKE